MDLLSLLVIFLIIASLIPLVRQRIIVATRARLMREFESKRGSRLIALIHRQEQMSFLGVSNGSFY